MWSYPEYNVNICPKQLSIYCWNTQPDEMAHESERERDEDRRKDNPSHPAPIKELSLKEGLVCLVSIRVLLLPAGERDLHCSHLQEKA